ncbi:2-dehydro-3-deoxyphosphooctonate aldolase (KDO 8-P synthase) [Aestuariispira insulae]|uniref:2-dehydro-3-deoxyphosphooctonate aldolase n=1 Tax=Aestuariispira insulae TaxID=1461337 RepID=A0A3D9HV70_9PROT|nr:2-dehydro-3-deoxyphosphooctonate aldolase (KDO 8-P synthase) [Aestuariispira insulae]
MHHVKVGDLTIGNDLPFTLLAGPCAMESRDHAMDMAQGIKEITDRLGIGLIYKSSFDKANRTSINSPRGIGLEKALAVFEEVKNKVGIPVVTDIHEPGQCAEVATVVDVLQVPAFLCRQTDLIVAAAETGKAVNVKKGQFLAPWDMANVVKKFEEVGNPDVMLCERGASFGYNTLVTDFRGLPTMAQTGKPVVFDATHSVQQPGGQGGTSGGQREFVPVLSRAAMAVGVAAVFMEVHQQPEIAPSDGPNMIPLHKLEELLSVMKAFDGLAKAHPVSIA